MGREKINVLALLLWQILLWEATQPCFLTVGRGEGGAYPPQSPTVLCPLFCKNVLETPQLECELTDRDLLILVFYP